jgi:hypothetical protein
MVGYLAKWRMNCRDLRLVIRLFKTVCRAEIAVHEVSVGAPTLRRRQGVAGWKSRRDVETAG